MILYITDRNIRVYNADNQISYNSDYIAEFRFDEEWNGKIKTARFVQNGEYVDVVLVDDRCEIPPLKTGFVRIGVFSDSMTSTYADLYFKTSIKDGTGIPTEPPEDVYAQLTALIESGILKGEDGLTPYVGSNNNWWIGDIDTGVLARGTDGEDGYTPVKGADYFTEEEIQQIQNEVSGGAIGDFKAVVDEETATFNANAESTLTGYNANAQEKFNTYNANADSKFETYNTNAETKFSGYNTNAEEKLSEYNKNDLDKTTLYNTNADSKFTKYNTNAEAKFSEYTNNADTKLAEYNQNDSDKTDLYNANAESKFTAYNENADNRLSEYNQNAAEKLKAYNDNHTEKMTAYDTNATEKLTTYNRNAEQHTTDYNRNAEVKLEAYNSNHAAKVAEYNTNAETKTAEFDANAAAIRYQVTDLKSDLVDSHKNIADFITLPQLLDNSQFIEGKELQNNALVSTPNDMDDVEGWTTTNIIELNWEAVDGNRTFETNLKTGQFKALGYYLRNGEYVRSASISATEEYNGHYKFSIPEVNVKMRISLYTKVVNADDIIITKLGEWTDNPTYIRNRFVLKDGIIKKNNLAKDVRLKLYPENPCHYMGNEFQIFKNVLCIGDSLTEGTFDYFEGTTRKYFVDKDYSYPTILSALTGRNVLNKGYGGDTFQSWYNRYKDEDLSGFDCAIIELGLNDSTQGTTSEDRLTYLGNIVNKLKLENNGIKIFISTILKCYSNSNIQSVNADIISFANSTENCYLMNVYENGSIEPNTPYVSGHLTVLGYQRLARDYYAYASKIIADNISEFQFVQYIGSTKQYQ